MILFPSPFISLSIACPVGTAIPQNVAYKWLTSDLPKKKEVVTNNLTVSGLSETQKDVLYDFAFKIRNAPSRIASFTRKGADFFLGYMRGQDCQKEGLLNLFIFGGEYFKFEPIN